MLPLTIHHQHPSYIMSQPQGYPHYQDSPAHQAASRKMKRKHQGGGSQQQQQQRQHPSHLRGGPGGGSSGAGRQAFLVPPGSTGPMAWGHAYEDEGTDMIMGEYDARPGYVLEYTFREARTDHLLSMYCNTLVL
jgi:hypothetical protein